VGRVDRFFNVTVVPPQDSPVGRVKAELRFKAVFTDVTKRSMGPLAVNIDLDYVLIHPYRSMVVRLADYLSVNTVPDKTMLLEHQLTKAQHIFKGNSTGYVTFLRIPDGVYRITVLYDSPYDGEKRTISDRFYVLADLASTVVIKNDVYEAHVKSRSHSVTVRAPLENEVEEDRPTSKV